MQRRSQTCWRFSLFQARGISDHSSEALACHYPFGVGFVFQPFWSKIVDSWTNSVDRQGLSFDFQGRGPQIDPRAPCCMKLVSAEKKKCFEGKQFHENSECTYPFSNLYTWWEVIAKHWLTLRGKDALSH